MCNIISVGADCMHGLDNMRMFLLLYGNIYLGQCTVI